MIKSIALSPVRPARRTGFGFFKLVGLARQRKTLAELDDRILQDIGVTRQEALREADRPVWDAPSNWKR